MTEPTKTLPAGEPISPRPAPAPSGLEVASRSDLAVMGAFDSGHSFTHAQRVAKMLVNSQLVPEHFRGEANIGNAVLALDMALRLKMNPLLVMQQCYLVYGKPAWSAQFIIGVLNASKRFESIRFETRDLGPCQVGNVKFQNLQTIAWTTDRGVKLPDGAGTLKAAKEKGIPVLEGPPITIEMAVRDGWYERKGSKWQTLAGLMLHYRAATFFGRLYAPELLMGLPTVEELEDLGTPTVPTVRPVFAAQTPRALEAETPPALPPVAASPPGADELPADSEPQPPGERSEMAQDAPEQKSAVSQPPQRKDSAESKPDAPASPKERYVKAVKGLCAAAGIPEGTVLDFCSSMGISDGSAATLSDLAETELKTLHDHWGGPRGIAARIKQLKG